MYISNSDDRLKIASILADNGYIVRIGKEKKDGAKNYSYFVEYWEE